MVNSPTTPPARAGLFGADDGVLVERRGPALYAVTYRGKTVRFHLYELEQAAGR